MQRRSLSAESFTFVVRRRQRIHLALKLDVGDKCCETLVLYQLRHLSSKGLTQEAGRGGGGRHRRRRQRTRLALRFSLYTILPSPILYGVWHKQGGSVGGRILRNGRAIVLQ